MKFLHTADWQIGMRAAHVGAVAERVREERFAAARRVVQTAAEQGVEFILVAGDTFEDNAVDRVAVQKVADILSGFAGQVYLIAGNHDPLLAGSVWDHPAWQGHSNLHVLAKPEPIDIAGGVLYPCPLFEKHSARNPTHWIDARHEDRIALGIAHGTVEGIPQEEPEYPIGRDTPARCGLDYLALGHWHSTATYQGADGAVRMAYSGTHETTRFGERDSGNVLVVEIASRGSPPQLEPIHTGGLLWKTIEEEIRAAGELGRVRESIESLGNPGSTLLELRLAGVLHAEDQAELARIREIVQARFPLGRIDQEKLLPAPEDDRWLAGFPDGPLRAAAGRLQQWSAEGGDGDRPEGATPEVAARALVELYAIFNKVTVAS